MSNPMPQGSGLAKNSQPVEKQTADAVAQPVKAWRRTILVADGIVGKPWRRYRARLFQGYLVGAVIIFFILAFLAKTIAYFTFDVTITREVQEIQASWFAAVMYALSWIGFSPQGLILSVLIFLFLWISGLKW